VILVVDMNKKKASLGYYEFVLPIVSIVKQLDEYTVKHYREIKQADLARCNTIILSGTPLKDNATLSQIERFEWLKTCEKPVLGVCAGMQTIGLVFGAKLKQCLGIGMTEITTMCANSLFSGAFSAYTLHGFSIEPHTTFDVLAESSQCIQAVKHRDRNVFGVLFHPEVRNPEILQRFVCDRVLNKSDQV
jgi:anthranilate/para-aminobenzoate synthase component II